MYAADMPRDTCTLCKRPLTDLESRIRGYGPVCAVEVFGIPPRRPRHVRPKPDDVHEDQLAFPIQLTLEEPAWQAKP